uniref:Uncharacterized protein n=1 Tax=Rhipicephalus zambeziensis TaxID=60191 RepID=A0A224Z006_9ACAR
MESSPNATNSSVAISSNEGNKVVTVMTNGVPHVLPSHGKTVFYIPDPPRYAVKPPPHGPPPTFVSVIGNSTKPSVPYVLYAPVTPVFHIPNPPEYALKPPPHGPPPTFFNATGNSSKHSEDMSTTRHVIISSRPSEFHIHSPSAVGTKEEIFESSSESSSGMPVRHSVNNTHNTHSVIVSAGPAVVKISSPLVPHRPTVKARNKTESALHPTTVVFMPAQTIVKVLVPAPYMFTTPRTDATMPPKPAPKSSTPTPPVVAAPTPPISGKSPSVNNVTKVVPTRVTTERPTKQVKNWTAVPNKPAQSTVADTRPSSGPQASPSTTKRTARASNKTFTHSVITKTTVNVTRNVTSHQPGPHIPLPKSTRSPRPALSHKTTRASVTAKTTRSYQPIGKKVIQDARRPTTKRYREIGKKVVQHAHRAKTEHFQTIEKKVIKEAHGTTTKRPQLIGKKVIEDAHGATSNRSNAVNVSMSSTEHVKVVKSVIQNHTSPVDFKLPNNTTVSPATGVTTPETIAEVVPAGRQELSEKASLTKRTARRPTYGPLPTPRRSSSDVKMSKERSVVSTTSTSKVTEIKNPGIFNLAAGLTSSVVEKAMKEAGSITAKPGTSLTDRSGTEIIAQPMVVLENATMQRPPPVILF